LIIDSLVAADIKPILITSGLTTRFLKMHFADKIPLLAAMVISLDSPNAEDHNANRGAQRCQKRLRAIGTQPSGTRRVGMLRFGRGT
jgi:hypothetical protein